MFDSKQGFTLIEVLLVIGIIAILAAIVIVAVNPARQFAQARNSQRRSGVQTILNAVNQNMIDNQGDFNCTTSLPTSSSTISSADTGTDICDCLIPEYTAELPVDPETGHFNSCDDYNTGFTISTTEADRVTVSAPAAELEEDISVTR